MQKKVRQQSSKSRLEQMKRQPALVIVFLLAVIALIMILVFVAQLPRETGTEAGLAESGDRLAKIRSYTYEETRELDLCGERIISLSADHFQAQDLSGVEIARENLNFHELFYVTFQDSLIMGDRREPGQNIYYFQRDALLWSSPLSGTFAGARLSADVLAVIDNPDHGPPSLHLLKRTDGHRIYTLTFDESGYIADFSFTPDGRALDVLLINTKTSDLKTIIKRYDLQGGQMAQFIPDLKNSFLHSLSYLGQDLVLYGEDKIYFVKPDAEQGVQMLENPHVYRLFSHAGQLYGIVQTKLGEPPELIKISGPEQVESLKTLPREAQMAEVMGSYLLLACGRDMIIYNLERQSFQTSVTLPDEAIAMSYDGAGTAYILTPTSIQKLILN